MIYTWDLSPIAFHVLGHPIRWYGLGYLLGFSIMLYWGWKEIQYFKKHKPERRKQTGRRYFSDYHEWEYFVFVIFMVGIVGGRISHFLFFNPTPLIEDPLEVFRVWTGGMASEGGFILSILGAIYLAKKKGIHLWILADTGAAPLAFAFGFGRLGNFMNGELVGPPTNGNWGVIFPHIDELPRHVPVLYEFTIYMIVVALVTILFFKWKSRPTGILFPISIVGAAAGRFVVEYFKISPLDIGPFTSGQILCLVLIAGAYEIWRWLLGDPQRIFIDK